MGGITIRVPSQRRIDFVMIDKGIVEIGGKRIEVAREDIRKLKFILDELSIVHIIDGVSFCRTLRGPGRMEDLYDIRMLRAENDGKVHPVNRSAYQGKIQFREMKIPNFCLLDFISLAQLDDEQAELLGDLVYGTQY